MPTPSGFSSGHRLVDPAGDAGLVQAQRQREPADAGADDEDLGLLFHALCHSPKLDCLAANRRA